MIRKKTKYSLAAKIIISVIVVLSIVGLLAGYLMAGNSNKILSSVERDRLGTLLQEQTHEIGLLLRNDQEIIQKVAELPMVVQYMDNSKKVVQDRTMLDTFKTFPLISSVLNLYLLDTNGKTVLSIDPQLLGNDYSFRDYFKEAMASQSAVTWAIGATTKIPGIYFSQPVVGRNNKIVGVAVIKVDTARIKESLMQSHLSDLGNLLMVDGNGVVIHSNKPETIYKSLGQINTETKNSYLVNETYLGKDIESLQYDQLQKLVIDKNEFAIFDTYDKEDKMRELLSVAKIDGYPFYLVEEENLDQIDKNIASLIYGLIITLLGATVVISLLELLLIRVFLRPLSRLTKYSESVASGNTDEELKVELTGDEVQSLGDSIKTMVTSLRDFSRGLEGKVNAKTMELEKSLSGVEEQNKRLEEARQAMLNVLEDLDEEKRNISNEKNRVETILSSIADGVFVTDTTGRVSMLNAVAQQMSGIDENEALGKLYSEIFRLAVEGNLDEVYPDYVDETIKTGQVNVLLTKTILITKEGKEIPTSVSASPLIDSEGNTFGCVVVVHDNTKERNLDRSKDEFLSVASHQLRTPLGGMRWNLEMIKTGDYGPVSPEINEVVETIHQGTLKMIDLVNDLLNVSRIDQGRVMDEPTETDLTAVVKEAVTSLTPIANKDGVSINMNIGEGVPKVMIDAKRFNEVVINLVSNAVKYHTQNGKVDVNLSFADDVIKMVIADNGIGIPKNDVGRVFDKFFRAGNAAKSETEGSGLGLYICKKFIDGWGGKITFDSEEGKGSTFTVLLPRNIRNIKTT